MKGPLRLAGVFLTLGLVGCGGGSGEADSGENAWVVADRLNRRTCGSSECGVVGQYFLGERVSVFEVEAGWARVSRYYRATCEGGVNEYVDEGNNACRPANGVTDGRFAEWVSIDYLGTEPPPDPAAGATGYHALVSGSDDYRTYADAFAKAASDLIASGQCSRADFEEMGGWIKSTVAHADEPVYFTYCGGMTLQNRLYLNAQSGRVFR